MHKLLENSLSTQAQSRLAEDEVDTLRTLTERQDRQIDDLMKEMDAIVTEVCPLFLNESYLIHRCQHKNVLVAHLITSKY